MLPILIITGAKFLRPFPLNCIKLFKLSMVCYFNDLTKAAFLSIAGNDNHHEFQGYSFESRHVITQHQNR